MCRENYRSGRWHLVAEELLFVILAPRQDRDPAMPEPIAGVRPWGGDDGQDKEGGGNQVTRAPGLAMISGMKGKGSDVIFRNAFYSAGITG